MCDSHPDAWISGCDKLGIDITAKGAQSTVREFRRRWGEATASDDDPENLRQRYSPEAFVDAIVDFIVSDDQVNSLFYCLPK